MSNAEFPTPSTGRSLLGWLRLWLFLREPVGQGEYAVTGFGLMAFKYLVEFVAVGQLTGKLFTPLDL